MHSNKITEKQNQNSLDIDKKSIDDIIKIINNEDSKIHTAINNIIPEISAFTEDVIKCLKTNGRLFYIGAGTSGRLGVLDASECPPTYNTDPKMVQGLIAGGIRALVNSVEGAEDDTDKGKSIIEKLKIGKNDIILGISASGTTPYVLSALKTANKNKSITGLLSCNNTESSNYIKHNISILLGPEVVTGSTRMKAGTATKMILNMISTTAMIKLNKTYGNIMVDLNANNKKLYDRATRIIMYLTKNNYNESLELLKKSSGNVKIAIIMHFLKISYKNAKQMLFQANGSVRDVLDI